MRKRKPLPPTPGNIRKARAFVLVKWRERAAEMGRPQPRTARGACKFASLFAAAVFGGDLRGNWQHQWAEVDGQIIDLSVRNGDYTHDITFFGNADHAESMTLCMPRVAQWLAEFAAHTPK